MYLQLLVIDIVSLKNMNLNHEVIYLDYGLLITSTHILIYILF